MSNTHNTNNHFNKSKPQVYQPKFTMNKTPYPNNNNKQFNFKAPQMPTRNANFQRPEPMSVQTRQMLPYNNAMRNIS